MRSPFVKKASHVAEYALLRLIEAGFSLPPRPLALKFGALLGMLLYHGGFRRNIVRKNMAYVGLWSLDERERITRRLYRTMGRYIADFMRVHRRLPPYDFPGFHLIAHHLTRGKGIIAVLGHFGNWEILTTLFGRSVQMHVVVMPMKNRLVDEWLARKRAATGVVTINKRNALRGILSALKDNRLVAVLIDQNARDQGTMTPFMGREASTVRTVAGLLHHTDCSIFLVHALLRPDGAYTIVLEEGRELGVPRDNQEAFIAAYQKEHNDVLSRWIRQDPEHWFGWFHRRFGSAVKY
jgi:KDO2-lipid IV(A) lauroyltransferase